MLLQPREKAYGLAASVIAEAFAACTATASSMISALLHRRSGATSQSQTVGGYIPLKRA
jgi:hypothetical protein